MNKLYETTDAAGIKIIVCPKGSNFAVKVAVVGGYYTFQVKKTLRAAVTAANNLAA